MACAIPLPSGVAHGLHAPEPERTLPDSRQYKVGLSRRQIAEGIGRDTTTISRELRRSAGVEGVYATQEAHNKSVQRWHMASAHPRIEAAAWKSVDAKLHEQWSPG